MNDLPSLGRSVGPAGPRRLRRALLLLLAGVAGCDPAGSGRPDSGATPSRGSTAAAPARVVAASSPASPPPGRWVAPTNLVSIKAGSFVRLKHTVTLTEDYWLGRCEVTQAEFEAVLGRNPSYFPGHPDAPVEKVSHFDAQAYCTVLTRREREAGRLPSTYEYRLPTEAEWEYACRAGTTNQFSFGDAAADAEAYAWTSENSGNAPHPVGMKRPNPWGLHDMHGNVWEWCLDWYADYPPTDLTDPTGPPQGKTKVFRGGGWNNEAPFARSSNRFTMAPASGIHFVGFRVALARTRPVVP